MVTAASQLSIITPDPHHVDRPPSSPVNARLQRRILMDRVVDLLVQKAMAGVHWPEVYSHAERILTSVPLAASGRRMAFQRIHNAESYAISGEFGAAAYELRMLRTQLA